MKELKFTYVWSILVVLLLFSIDVGAQSTINGVLGVDFHAISSSSESHANSYTEIDAVRFLSNHYIGFSNAGFIKNENFADYSLSTKLKGSFTSMNTGLINESSYLSPNLNSFTGNFYLFPKRSYNLSLYYVKLKDIALRYNETNRSKTELLTPSLAVLQKNRIDDNKYGAIFSSVLFKGAQLKAEYNNNSIKNSFDYDFGENRNIIITTLELPGDIFSNTVSINFVNNIKDDTVRIISGIINEIIPPEFSIVIEFDTGFHLIDIIPLHTYKQSSISINAKREQRYLINIDAEEFPAQSENVKESTDSRFDFDYQGDALTIQTSYTFDDAFRKNVGLREVEKELKNSINYDLTRKIKLALKTEKISRENSRDDIADLSTESFKNNTLINYEQRKGFLGSIGHEYKDDNSINPDGTIDNTINTRFTSRFSLPSDKFKHNITLNSELSLQDQTGRTISNTTNKSAMLINRMELYFKNIKLTPSNSIKLDSRHKVSDSIDTRTSEMSFNSTFEGSQNDTKLFGDISSKLRHSYTTTEENKVTKTNSLFGWEVLLLKNISEDQSISFNMAHSWKFTGDTESKITDTVTLEPITEIVVTPTQYTNSISLGYTSSKYENIDFSTVLSVANSTGSQTINISFTLETYIPFIKFPLTTEIIKQNRNLEGLPQQTSFKVESQISFRYNQINLRIKHFFTKEKLILDTYKFYELSINITRDFGI